MQPTNKPCKTQVDRYVIYVNISNVVVLVKTSIVSICCYIYVVFTVTEINDDDDIIIIIIIRFILLLLTNHIKRKININRNEQK